MIKKIRWLQIVKDLNKIDSAQTKVQINALVFGQGLSAYW